jgi:hypothetical protein
MNDVWMCLQARIEQEHMDVGSLRQTFPTLIDRSIKQRYETDACCLNVVHGMHAQRTAATPRSPGHPQQHGGVFRRLSRFEKEEKHVSVVGAVQLEISRVAFWGDLRYRVN